ncbi:MAG: ABC transporter ATP-binding protein [Deltaproteobacteria bacterium]|nr:ABC transporter ATP-binding protein [Deltaproteobacteria bacterium]
MISIRDLHYSYPDGTLALRGVTLDVAAGEFLAVCGPNGSGKTTLIRHMNGLLTPRTGSVVVDGYDTVQAPQEVIRRVGMVFQDADSQILGETVWEDVAFGPRNLRLNRDVLEERVASALKAVNLTDLAQKPCHLLSGGEKRRVAIAGVLAMRSPVIIFDEPFANLDYPGVREVLQHLLRLREQGHTLIVTTHDVEKVVAHVDRLAVLFNGELRAVGHPEEVIPHLRAFEVRPPCFTYFGERMLSWLTD